MLKGPSNGKSAESNANSTGNQMDFLEATRNLTCKDHMIVFGVCRSPDEATRTFVMGCCSRVQTLNNPKLLDYQLC